MANDRANRKPAVVAAIAASCLMLLLGLVYRVLASQLGAPVRIRNRTPMDRHALEQFPRQIGGWIGQDIPLDDAIVRKTGTDAHINRRYSRPNGPESVSLYLASGVKARTLVGHRPEICYVATGWTPGEHRSVEITLSDGVRVPCSILEFSRGGLNTTKMTVLNYFIVDGQYYGDVATLQSKAGRRLGTVGYVAQVQIGSAESLSTDLATRIVSDFAADCGPPIARLFENIEEERGSGKTRKAPGGR